MTRRAVAAPGAFTGALSSARVGGGGQDGRNRNPDFCLIPSIFTKQDGDIFVLYL